MWTFEMMWPAPFEQKWVRSQMEYATADEAAKALGEWLAISADNGTIMTGRLVRL
jgi:hypothetical protein